MWVGQVREWVGRQVVRWVRKVGQVGRSGRFGLHGFEFTTIVNAVSDQGGH